MTARALFNLFPKQQYAFDLIWRDNVEQLLYGGAAGGGKSELVRALAAYLAMLWPGSVVGIFRRTDHELQNNHVEPWLSDVDPYVPGGVFLRQRMEYQWPAPAWCWCEKGKPCTHSSVTAFRHVDDNRGARKHQGTEFAAEIVDEATHFHGADIDFLYTRVRAPADKRMAREIIGPDGGAYDYPGWPQWRRLQLLTANPGDVGHQYMLDNYVEPVEALRVGERSGYSISDGPHQLTDGAAHRRWITDYQRPDGDLSSIEVDVSRGASWTVELAIGGGRVAHIKRAFVPASLADNPMLDPIEYAATLAIGSAEQKQRLLDGDWSYSEDKVFKMLERETHLVDGGAIFGLTATGQVRPPPRAWPRGIGQDHGTTKPTAAVWVAYDDEGFLIAYREYYAPGPVGKHIEGIRQIMDWDGHRELVVEADPRLWHRNQGVDEQVSVAAIYQYGGLPPNDPVQRRAAEQRGIRLRPSHIEDRAALDALMDMLEPDPERLFPYWHRRSGEFGAPLLFITEDCPALWRELTNLKHPGLDPDGNYQEGVKTGQPDHGFDALKRIAEPLRRRIISPRPTGPRYVLEAV